MAHKRKEPRESRPPGNSPESRRDAQSGEPDPPSAGGDAASELIDLDVADSVDPADAIDREQLIAETMALVASEDDGAHSDDTPTPIERHSSEPTTAAPVIGETALAALRAMKSEGVTLPDELVLDLGEATTPQERDRLVRSAGAQADMQDAVYRVSAYLDRTRGRRKGLIGLVLCAVAIGIAIRPPGWVVPPEGAQLTEADHLYGVRVTLLLQAQQIEAFREREERLPTSLAEVTVTFPRVSFARLDNQLYQLVAYTPDGDAVLYDSTAPGSEFLRIRATWITTAAGS